MGYTYLEHVSDVCLRAEGRTLAEAIESGAEAMFNVSFDLETIAENKTVAINAEARTPELLFIEVLNECLSLQAIGELALKRLLTKEIKKLDNGLSYAGAAYGEPFDRGKHTVKTEVKGATYSGLTYNNGAGGTHMLTCVLDV